MNARWVRLFWLSAGVFLLFPQEKIRSGTVRAEAEPDPVKSPPAAQEMEESRRPPPELTLGFLTGDSETEGLGDLLIPLWDLNGNGILFINPRSAFTDRNGEEYNLGGGIRRLLPHYGLLLGANLYYDYRDTGDHTYDQWGAGVELLSSWLDARANYYRPDDKKMVVSRQTRTEVSRSATTTEGWNRPYAQENLILQDYAVTQTLTTMTTTRAFEQVQQPLGGYDWEIGLRIPLPVQQETLTARVFGGMYDFKRDFGEDASGWKARAEIRIFSTFFLDGGLYENDRLTGSDWYAGARVTVPLNFNRAAGGDRLFSTARSRLNREPRGLQSRLTEMVLRDPQIRIETSPLLENPELGTRAVTTSQHAQRQTFALLEDVVFVDGDAPAAGNGSAANPFSVIQDGVVNVFGQKNVYVHA
ncbi:MAG: inverse autotransporter beta domain-containing protein, partial [Kiritimatiellia bacterium]|nr:inverse autotransporter beta domain-containing protein [Kiritimatiellia bacterium]